MTTKKIIDGLYFTVGMMLFNPATGEAKTPDELNEDDRYTYDACMGAIELLKAQEPRVMTLDELVMWQKQPVIERYPIYVEYRKGKGFGAPHWAMDNFGFNVATCQDNYKSSVYGMLVRCWTSRPDEKRMAETPWE